MSHVSKLLHWHPRLSACLLCQSENVFLFISVIFLETLSKNDMKILIEHELLESELTINGLKKLSNS